MPNALVDDLLRCLRSGLPNVAGVVVDQVHLGWAYTGVRLNTGDVGLCHSLLSESVIKCCHQMTKAGTIAGTMAIELAELAGSWHLGERVIGVATINALSQIALKHDHPSYAVREGNVADEIEVRSTDTVGIVGNIKPLVAMLKDKVARLHIFERGGSFEDGILPDTACEELLKEADVVLITGSAIAN